MSVVNHSLAFAGVLLFLLGLLNGLIIPLGRSPRLGLSAHLTAVQSGTFLIAASLLWPHIGVPEAWREVTASGLWLSLYALWLALLFAGILGAGHGLPIAGGGIRTKRPYQIVVSVFLTAGILGSTIATAAMAYWTALSV